MKFFLRILNWILLFVSLLVSISIYLYKFKISCNILLFRYKAQNIQYIKHLFKLNYPVSWVYRPGLQSTFRKRVDNVSYGSRKGFTTEYQAKYHTVLKTTLSTTLTESLVFIWLITKPQALKPHLRLCAFISSVASFCYSLYLINMYTVFIPHHDH